MRKNVSLIQKEAAREASSLCCRRSVSCWHPDGVHCRVAAAIVKASARFDSKITVMKGAMAANAKSIMSLLMLSVAPGEELVIVAEGRDAVVAAGALELMLSALNSGGLEAAVANLADACPSA